MITMNLGYHLSEQFRANSLFPMGLPLADHSNVHENTSPAASRERRTGFEGFTLTEQAFRFIVGANRTGVAQAAPMALVCAPPIEICRGDIQLPVGTVWFPSGFPQKNCADHLTDA
jgi:hypothetical protein